LIDGVNNPADIFSKHWGYYSVWHMHHAIMYTAGDTIDSPSKMANSHLQVHGC